MEYGRHGTVTNATSWTRVSLDFRVVNESDFDADAPISWRPDGGQRFGLGGYYRLSDPWLGAGQGADAGALQSVVDSRALRN